MSESGSRVLVILLDHRNGAQVHPLIERWNRVLRSGTVLLAYGGNHFDEVEYEPKLLITDPRLRTRDHQRERQTCLGLFKQVLSWMETKPAFDFIHLVEFDHVALVSDLIERLLARINSEHADLLGYRVQQIDDTNHPHFLGRAHDAAFASFLSSMSCRSDPDVVLSMLGTGLFWRRDAFEAVCRRDEPFPIYGELYFPTVAHHLGFRVRDMEGQRRFVTHQPQLLPPLEVCRRQGAWSVHPVKTGPLPEILP